MINVRTKFSMIIRIVYSFEFPGRGTEGMRSSLEPRMLISGHKFSITSLFKKIFIVSYLSCLSNHLACKMFNAISISLMTKLTTYLYATNDCRNFSFGFGQLSVVSISSMHCFRISLVGGCVVLTIYTAACTCTITE